MNTDEIRCRTRFAVSIDPRASIGAAICSTSDGGSWMIGHHGAPATARLAGMSRLFA